MYTLLMCMTLSIRMLSCQSKVITICGYYLGNSQIVSLDNQTFRIYGKPDYPTSIRMFFNLKLHDMYNPKLGWDIIEVKRVDV